MAHLRLYARTMVVGWLICLLPGVPVLSAEISGRVWNDTNRDGLLDSSEPVFTNAAVYLLDAEPQITVATNFTASNGSYAFYGVSNNTYRIYVSAAAHYGITTPDAGTNDNVDSDLTVYSFSASAGGTAPFVFSGISITNINAGFIQFTPGLHVSVTAGQAREGYPLFVTNGTWVPFTFVVSNVGDIALSAISIYDYKLDDIVGEINCPLTLPNLFAQTFVFTNSRAITSSETNTVDATGVAVNPLFCNDVFELDPTFTATQVTVLVVSGEGDSDGDQIPNAWEIRHQLNPLVSNSPGANADSDWMTDYEEYLADTDPTNAASVFPSLELSADALSMILQTTSADRVYGIYSTDALLDNPQTWPLIAPEQTGTGSAITFIITNDISSTHFRAGARP